MIYWHVERKSVCVYSQVKTCSSSEVAAMMEGLIRHSNDIDSAIEANYTDTHGASIVGFAFCHLLGYRLLPRFKNIGSARLYRPGDGITYPGLETVLSRPIRWDLINQQYDQMIKYARALQLGTAEAEQVLRPRPATRPRPAEPRHPACHRDGVITDGRGPSPASAMTALPERTTSMPTDSPTPHPAVSAVADAFAGWVDAVQTTRAETPAFGDARRSRPHQAPGS